MGVMQTKRVITAGVALATGGIIGALVDVWLQHSSYELTCPHAVVADDVCTFQRHVTASNVVAGGLIGLAVVLFLGVAALLFMWLVTRD